MGDGVRETPSRWEPQRRRIRPTLPGVARLDRITIPLPPVVTGLYRHPAVGLARLAEEIRAYWTVAILPHWQRIQRLIEGEVLYRARMMARGGAGELFPGNPGSSTRHAASPRCGSAGSRARRTGWPESSAGPGRCSSPYSAPPPRPPSSPPAPTCPPPRSPTTSPPCAPPASSPPTEPAAPRCTCAQSRPRHCCEAPEHRL